MDENRNLPDPRSGETDESASSSNWWDSLGSEQSHPSAPTGDQREGGQQSGGSTPQQLNSQSGSSQDSGRQADPSPQSSPWAPGPQSDEGQGYGNQGGPQQPAAGASQGSRPQQGQYPQPQQGQYLQSSQGQHQQAQRPPSQQPQQGGQSWGASYPGSGGYPGQGGQYPGQGGQYPGQGGQYPGRGPTDQSGMGQPSGQGPLQQVAEPRSRKGLKAGAVALIAVLAAGAGGLSGWAVNAGGDSDSASSSPSSTVTKVVQGSSSAPDWTATASAVSDSVVSISIRSSNGTAAGSGVVLDSKGNIVTNNHVVASASGSDIQVALGDRTYTATVVGTDPSSDLAVIRLSSPPKSLKPISFGNSDKLSVGAPVMAIGNPLGLSGSVTTGIISALNRPVSTSSSDQQSSSGDDVVVTNAIQTSAPINPGNSGGALINAGGQLIGINSSIASLSSGSSSSQSGSIGIGFAIPANLVKNITDQLISTGKAKHAFLGLTTQDATATVDGVQVNGAGVRSVESGAPADKAGVREGDVVIKVNSTTVTSGEGLVGLVRSRKVGEKVTLTLVRDGAEQKVSATLAAAQE